MGKAQVRVALGVFLGRGEERGAAVRPAASSLLGPLPAREGRNVRVQARPDFKRLGPRRISFGSGERSQASVRPGQTLLGEASLRVRNCRTANDFPIHDLDRANRRHAVCAAVITHDPLASPRSSYQHEHE
jgi:hypothetical protein